MKIPRSAFAGPVSGDVTGAVEARIIRRVLGIEPGQNLLQADYVGADGLACSKGTLYITPRWKQTHDEND